MTEPTPIDTSSGLQDVQDRLHRAVQSLRELRSYATNEHEAQRLMGKADGTEGGLSQRSR